MNTISAVAATCLIGVAAQAQLIDDYTGDLSAYTSTVILDNNGGGANTAVWEIAGGTLQLNTTVRDGTGVEQYAMIYGGLSLAVGYEVQVDLTHSGASQDLGLYVGGTTPVAFTRQDYVAVYARNSTSVYSRGFDGTVEYGLVGGGGRPFDKLFIARSGVNTYDAGYYNAGSRTVMVTRTPTTANDADVIGFYADVRGVGILGNLDNLTIAPIPEPSTVALVGLGLAGLVALRRRR